MENNAEKIELELFNYENLLTVKNILAQIQ